LVYCAQYRFALQLLLGIKQNKDQGKKEKECYLYGILINLPLDIKHRVNFIIDAVKDFFIKSST